MVFVCVGSALITAIYDLGRREVIQLRGREDTRMIRGDTRLSLGTEVKESCSI
jgi:hypothetical protein